MKRITHSTLAFTIALVLITIGTISCGNSNRNSASEGETSPPSTTIHEAAFFGNTKAINEHIAASTDLNQQDSYGSTPLHIAATFGKNEVAQLLIKAGADLNALNADGSTPLHTAAFMGREEIVKALLDKGVDTSIRNQYGATALESVAAPFSEVKPVYDQLSKDLGPLGLKLDYKRLEEVRPVIAGMIAEK